MTASFMPPIEAQIASRYLPGKESSCGSSRVVPETLDRGSTGGLTFSRPEQTFIYISDIMKNVVWIVNRADGRTLGHFGFFSHAGGGFHWLHMVATDSKGNVYTGEVDTGKRVQRFVLQR